LHFDPFLVVCLFGFFVGFFLAFCGCGTGFGLLGFTVGVGVGVGFGVLQKERASGLSVRPQIVSLSHAASPDGFE
jgi:hypothetical protein